MHEDGQDGETIIPLVSEDIRIGKREVVRDRARVRVVTDEEQRLLRAELAREDVEIRHVEMNRLLEPGAPIPQPRVENGVTIIPVFQEVAVAVTRIELKEEIHIIRHPSREVAEIPVTLRSQRAVVERLAAGGEPNTGTALNRNIGGQIMTSRTITAFFDQRSDAMSAVERLASAGVPRSQIRILPETEYSTDTTSSSSSYDINRDEKGFWESLADMFFPAEDRYSYAEAMHRGDIMVTATVDDTMASLAEDILEEDGTVNIDEREASWRNEGWAGYEGASASLSAGSDASAASASSTSVASESGRTERASAEREGVIPLAEEELRVGKRDVNRGRVKVRSYVVETPVEESVSLREEQVNLERRHVDRVLGEADADRLFKERSIEVEERGEEAIVEKRARVREEVAIGKTVEERNETVRDTVRRTEVEIDDERSGDDTTRRRRA